MLGLLVSESGSERLQSPMKNRQSVVVRSENIGG